MKSKTSLLSSGLVLGIALSLFASIPIVAQSQKNDGGAKPDPFVKDGAAGKSDPDSGAVGEGDGKLETYENVGAIVQFIDVPREQWQEWREKNGVKFDSSALRKEVDGWMGEGKAELADTAMILTRSGQRGMTNSVRELIYPTKTNSFEGVYMFPNVYETRNLGLNFELDPVLNADGSVAINFAPERVHYEGENPPTVDPRAGVEEGDVMWPEFFTQGITATLEADPGQWILVGTETSVQRRETHQTLVFLRPVVHRFEIPQVGDPNGQQGTVTFEWIETTHEQVSQWMQEKDTSAMVAGGVRAAADEAIQQGSARMVENRVIRFRSGQRVKNESIREISYPTEFDPPKGEQFAAPHAVETRNVGVTVEMDAVLAASGLALDINVAPEIVSYHGRTVHHRREVAGEWVPDVTMPVFYAMYPTTGVIAPVEVPLLISVMTPPDAQGNPDSDRKVLFFLKVTR